MDYAIAGHKNLAGAWAELRSQRRKKQKKGGSSLRLQNGLNVFSFLWVLLKTLVSWTTKITLAAALGYGVYFGCQYLTTSPHFAVTQIKLTGNQTIPEHELMEWMGPVTGKNIFLLNLDELSTKLAGHPWVRTASVRKSFPQNILIHLEERTPYARIKLDREYVLDNYGVIISDQAAAYQSLPLIVHPSSEKTELGQNAAGEGIISGLKTMHYFNKMSFFADNPITTAEIDKISRITFITRNGSLKIFMNLNTIDESIKDFLIVRNTLEKQKKTIEHIDLSFKDKIIVKQKADS